ncbi:MAG: Dph6-related ATP pyrophosphatase [Verrucomicrobiales bacterium]
MQRDVAKDHHIVLVTTFDAAERQVAHQELSLADIIRQDQHLELPLLGIPLHPGRDYADAVEPALRLIQNPARLVFGDLHLEHIHSWREEAFAEIAKEIGATLEFPLWHADYEFLMQDLEESGVICEVSAITSAAEGQEEFGDVFDRELFKSLSDSIDCFGENGEFHTLAKVWEGTK